jgi:hypothetical protein
VGWSRFRGAVIAGLMAMSASPAWAEQWLRAESPHFVIYSAGSEKSVREYAAMLEDFDALLRVVHGRLPDRPGVRKLPVYLVGSNRGLREVHPHASFATAGFYASGEDDVFVVSAREGASGMGDSNKGDDVVLHEYVHHFLLQYFPAAYPAWLNEGYAEYFMTADLGERIVVGNFNTTRASWLTGAPWIPLRSVLSKSTEELSDGERGPYYAQAWLLTHYLMSDLGRRRQLSDLLRKMKTGSSADEAWQAVFGDPNAMRRKLEDYMTRPLTGSVWERDWKPAEVTVTALSPGAGAVLLKAQSLHFTVSDGEMRKPLKDLRQAAKKFPDDRAVLLALGRAESQMGDKAVGRALLEKLVAAEPGDVEALRWLAMVHIKLAEGDATRHQAEMREAGRLLAAAIKLEPDSYQTLYRYAQTRTAEPDYPTENTYNVLLKAVSLAPQVWDTRMAAADAAIKRSDAEMARLLLIPVANSPHPGEATVKARAMLKALRAEPAVTPPEAAASPARPKS